MKQRYILVLAANAQEGSRYARRLGLSIGNYRSVASAASILGIQSADAHILPGFWKRPDRHNILAALRYARDVNQIDVEMPDPVEPAPVDQGDGMGEQGDLLEALKRSVDRAKEIYSLPRTDIAGIAEEQNAARTPEPSEDAAPPPKAKRKTARPAVAASPRIATGMFD